MDKRLKEFIKIIDQEISEQQDALIKYNSIIISIDEVNKLYWSPIETQNAIYNYYLSTGLELRIQHCCLDMYSLKVKRVNTK